MAANEDGDGAILIRRGPEAFVESTRAGERIHARQGQYRPVQVLRERVPAIGIARCFATCATMQRPFYSPDDPMCRTREPDDKQWGVDHFFRKLLLLHERMHTEAARAMAKRRAEFMREFLDELETEIG